MREGGRMRGRKEREGGRWRGREEEVKLGGGEEALSANSRMNQSELAR